MHGKLKQLARLSICLASEVTYAVGELTRQARRVNVGGRGD